MTYFPPSPLPAAYGVPANYALLELDNSGPNEETIYLGYAIQGSAESASAWAIKQIIYDNNGNATGFLWATVTNGIPALNLVWNNRTEYSFN